MKYVLAKLNVPSKGLKGDWYVYYSAVNPANGEMERFRERKGLNRAKTIRERKLHGAVLIDRINGLLMAGWSPFAAASDAQQQKIIPLFKLMDQLFEIKKVNIRYRTRQHYKHSLDLLKEFLEYKSLSYISADGFLPATAQAFSDYMLTVKKHSGKSHNNQISCCRMFFNMMIDRDIIEKNPFRRVKKQPEDKGRHIPYSDQERKKVAKYLEKTCPPMLLICKFLYYCFIRPNELRQIQVKAIDWKNKRIKISAHISKNRKESSVEIPDVFMEDIKFLEDVDPNFYLFGLELTPGPKMVGQNYFGMTYSKLMEGLEGAENYTLYPWKHTGAIAFINNGGNVYSLMMQLRHHSLDQTTIYLNVLGMAENLNFRTKQPAF